MTTATQLSSDPFAAFRVLAIVPAYNEEASLPGVISDLQKLSPHLDVLVINDGSRDKTGTVARAHGAKVLDMPFNVGIGGAMQTGYLYAAREGYDVAVQVDGDGQHKPMDLFQIIRPILEGQAHATVGSRYLIPTGFRSTPMRRLGMIILSAAVSLVAGQRFTDSTSGYRAAGREAIQLFARFYPPDYPEPEALILLRKAKLTVREIPVAMEERVTGRSSITPLRSVYYMAKVLLAIFINALRVHKNNPPSGGQEGDVNLVP